jgi:hypothetical protein
MKEAMADDEPEAARARAWRPNSRRCCTGRKLVRYLQIESKVRGPHQLRARGRSPAGALSPERRMNTLIRLCIGLVLALGGLAAVSPALAQNSTLTPEAKEKEQKERLQLAADGLEKLYKLQPDSKATLEKGLGYAVFVVNSVYAIMFVGQRGKGVLFDNAPSSRPYMISYARRHRAGRGQAEGPTRCSSSRPFAMEQFMLAAARRRDVGASVSTGTDGMTRFLQSLDRHLPDPESGHGRAGQLGRHRVTTVGFRLR